MMVLGEIENTGEEAIVAYFKTLSQNLPVWNEKTCQDN
jgi:hypothetical protein